MLKRVRAEDVQLGMFIHKLEGSWFSHPFWKRKFLLQDAKMLANLHASRVKGVLIDTSKGLDIRFAGGQRPEPRPEERPARSAADLLRAREINAPRRPRPEAASAAELRSTVPTTPSREFGLARQVAGRSRKVISRVFLEARLGKAIRAEQVEPVVEEIFASIQRNPHTFNGLMRCKSDNQYLYRHALSVSALMISLARQMKLSPQETREAGMAGLLMDVGVSHLPVDLEPLDGDYRALPADLLKQHVVLGHDFLVANGGVPQRVLDVVLHHHERIDGSGYPAGLSGKAIGRLARMAAICDTFDALVADTGNGGIDPAQTMLKLLEAKDRFDPLILQKFVEAMGIYPVGSVVRLRSGRLGMVVRQAAADYTRPRVRPFWSIADARPVRAMDITLSECFGEDEIVETACPATYGVPDFPRIRERLFAASVQED